MIRIIGITIIIVVLIIATQGSYLRALPLGVAIIQMTALSGFTLLMVALIDGLVRKN